MAADAAAPRKRRRARKMRPPLPAPRFSSRLYVRLAPADVAMFRFLLEAEDNLAYMSTVDRWTSVLQVTFSPHQADAVRACLDSIRTRIPFDLAYVPDAAYCPPPGGQEQEGPSQLCPPLRDNLKRKLI